jgi:hypothetical protein
MMCSGNISHVFHFHLSGYVNKENVPLGGTRKSTRAPTACSPQRKIDCQVWDRILWGPWPLLL